MESIVFMLLLQLILSIGIIALEHLKLTLPAVKYGRHLSKNLFILSVLHPTLIKDGLPIEDVTVEAFTHLGNNGIIQAAHGHACSECSQPYKATADTIPNVNVTMAENQDASVSQELEGREVDNMEIDDVPFVTMAVLDGIVMGPTHCAFDNCTADLDNYRGGAFCPEHEIEFGAKCRVRDCQNDKVDSTQACTEHQPQWKKHIQNFTQHSMAGVCRMLQRPDESLPWNPIQRRNHQPHDEDAPEVKLANFFRPP